MTERKINLLKRGYNKSRRRKEQLRQARREEKKVHRKKKREYEKRIWEELEATYAIKDTRKFYKKLNDVRKGFQPRISMMRKDDDEVVTYQPDVLELWKSHFDELLNSNSRMQAETQSNYEREDGKMIPEPTKQEVAAINILKNNKAPGFDGIPGELLKTGCEKLIVRVYELIKIVWRNI